MPALRTRANHAKETNKLFCERNEKLAESSPAKSSFKIGNMKIGSEIRGNWMRQEQRERKKPKQVQN